MKKAEKHTENKHGLSSEASAKEDYKKTKLGWIPEGWELKNLNEFGSFSKGKGISKSDVKKKGLPCVLYGDLYTKHKDHIKLFSNFIDKETSEKSHEIKKGDMLFAGSGETAEEIGMCAAYLDDDVAYAGGDIIVFTPKINDSRFLGYLMNHELVNRQKYKLAQGYSVVHLYSSHLKQISVPLPPLPEQKKIAEILSTWDRAIETLEQLIAKKEDLKKGLMQQLLTPKNAGQAGEKRFPGFEGEWREVRLDKIAKVVMGQSPKSEFYNEEKNGIPLLQGNNDIKNGKTVSNIYTTQITKECNAGDIILSVRAPVGDIGIATEKSCIGRGVCAIQAKRNFSAYLFNYLDYFENKWERYSQGSTFKAINSKDIRAFKIELPSTEKEIQFVNNSLNSVQKEIEILETQKKSFETQKKGLMQQLLTGKTKVNV